MFCVVLLLFCLTNSKNKAAVKPHWTCMMDYGQNPQFWERIIEQGAVDSYGLMMTYKILNEPYKLLYRSIRQQQIGKLLVAKHPQRYVS